MDSGNTTGSMESSSGGADDDEYTSRPSMATPTASFFPFMMNSSSSHLPFLHNPNNPPPPLPGFEALPNSFDQVVRPGSTDHHHHHQNQLFQLGAAASGDELGVMLPPPALQVPVSCHPGQGQASGVSAGGVPNLTVPLASDPLKLPKEHRERGNNNGVLPARRKPKKRTRASRRAPTTVLTTDTNNFRAMVQEFTGIPAPPFAAMSSPFQRARLDLFSTNLAGSTSALVSSLPPPSYLLRPFAHRLFQAAPLPTTSFVPVTTSGNDTVVSASTELFFSLLSNNENNIDGAPNATSSSSSILDFGQVLTKFSSDHDRERADQEQHQHPHSNLGPGGMNNDILEEFGLSRQGSQDHDHDRGHGFGVSTSASRNVAIANRSEGMRMESWICSSD